MAEIMVCLSFSWILYGKKILNPQMGDLLKNRLTISVTRNTKYTLNGSV